MFKNYFKIAWRNLRRNKTSSFINIGGLSVGMAVALLIGLWIWDELSFDHYFQQHKTLGQIVSVTTYNGSTTAHISASVPLATELREKFHDDLNRVALTAEGVHVLTANDKAASHWGMWAQPGLPVMLTLKMIKGSSKALSDPASMMIDASLAKALFGTTDPINKTIKVDHKTAMRVAGVYEDFPENTSFAGTDFLMAWDNTDNPGQEETDWSNHHYQLYVQINSHANFDKISDKIKDITKPHLKGGWEEVMLHPMDRWHLYNEFRDGKMAPGRMQYVWLFGMIGGFVLLLACINFMNLSTARSEKRAKEVGIRKAIGSARSQLILQFFSESLVTAFLSLLIALLLAQLSLPYFNLLASKNIFIPFSQIIFWIVILGFTVCTGLIAGSYPALYLSGFKPLKVLKGTFKVGRLATLPRKALVVVQFTVSISLIIGTLIIFRQLQFAKDRAVGYTREGLITVDMNTDEIRDHFDALRNELINTGVVSNAAVSSSPSTDVQNDMLGYEWKGKDPHVTAIIGTVFMSFEFGKTLGWKIKEGRDFSRDFPADSGAIILNEAAVKFTGFKKPVGESIRWHGREHMIVGVVKDMVMQSPYMPVKPTFFMLENRKIHLITIRIKPTISVRNALVKIETVFKKYDPASPFAYEFTDTDYARKFSDEEYIGNLATVFTVLAIFISCLGIFGLASFIAEQRTKEIGVRKILGASVFNLWHLLSKEFVILVFIALLIAVPISLFFMQHWLQHYSYRTELSWWIFAAAAAGSFLITLITVSFQAIKAALANPVKSLRTE